jgi:hypothetical protein
MGTRTLVEFVDGGTVAPRPLTPPFSATPLQARTLVGDLAAGDGAALVELPAGWSADGTTSSPLELIVLEGELHSNGRPLRAYGYVSLVPGDANPTLASPGGALVFVDANAEVRRPLVRPESEDGWEPGALPGLQRKLIRGELDGPRGFFLRIPAGWSEHRTEWHDCAEAALQLEGDLWHARANGGAGGTMRRESYFWRPPRVLHSPMGSDDGSLSWVYVDGRLVNHYVEDECDESRLPTPRLANPSRRRPRYGSQPPAS